MNNEKEFEVEVNNLRKQLDQIDEIIIREVYKRFCIIKTIGHLKQRYSIPMMQPNRVNQIYSSRKALARQIGLDENLIHNLYDILLAHSFKIEDDIIADKTNVE